MAKVTRRDFVAHSVAAATLAPVQLAGAQAVNNFDGTISLFGIVLRVDSNGRCDALPGAAANAKRPYIERDSSGRFEFHVEDTSLQIGEEAALVLSMSLPVERGPASTWRFIPTVAHATNSSTFRLSRMPRELRYSGQPAWGIFTRHMAIVDVGSSPARFAVDNAGTVSTVLPPNVAISSGATANRSEIFRTPLRIKSTVDANVRLDVDLQKKIVVLGRGALRCLLDFVSTLPLLAEMRAEDSVVLSSEPIVLDLDDPNAEEPLRFRMAGIDDWLPLHSLPADGKQVCTTLATRRMELEVLLDRVACCGKDSPVAKVRNLALRPIEPAGFQLRTANLVNGANQEVTWRCKDRLDLRVRPAGKAVAGALLVAPESNVSLTLGKATTIYGPIASARFASTRAAVLHGIGSTAASRLVSLDPPTGDFQNAAVFAQDTQIALELQASSFDRAKPGRSFSGGEATAAADIWVFDKGAPLAVPLVPERLAIARSHYSEFLARLNAFAVQAKSSATFSAPSIHETRIREQAPGAQPQSLRISRLFDAQASNGAARPRSDDDSFRLDPSQVEFLVPPFRLSLTLPALRNRAYYVVKRESLGAMDPLQEEKVVLELDRGNRDILVEIDLKTKVDDAIGLLKLSDELTMEEALQDAQKNYTFPGLAGRSPKEFAALVHRDVSNKVWKGLILFGLPLTFDEGSIFHSIVPRTTDGQSAVDLTYLAVTPSKQAASGPSLYASVAWPRKDSAMGSPDYASFEDEKTKEKGGMDHEASFRLKSLKADWVDTSIVRFDAAASVDIRSVLGITWSGGGLRRLEIQGWLQRAPIKEIRWAAALSEKLPLLTSGFGPIKQLYIKGATIAKVGEKYEVKLDGDVELQKLSFGKGSIQDWFQGLGDLIDFRGLGLTLPKPGTNWLPLKFSYPSLRLNLDKRHFSLFGLDWIQVKLSGFGVNWNGDFDWGSMLKLTSFGGKLDRALFIDFELNFGKLPALTGRSFRDLRFGFRFAMSVRGGKLDLSAFDVRLTALGFRDFELDLLRFLTLTVGSAEFESVSLPGPEGKDVNVPWLYLRDVSLRILDLQIFKGLTFAAFTNPKTRERGFLAVYPDTEDAELVLDTDLLDIYWLMIGRNLFLPQALSRNILSLDRPEDVDMEGAQPAEQRGAVKAIVDAFKDPKGLLSSGDQPCGEWAFGAGVGILNGFLEGKFLIQDRNVYGLALWGRAFEEWCGGPLRIAGTYFKRPDPSEDCVVLSADIPAFNPGPYRFTGGVITVEWGFNGSFFIDAGFPWPDPRGSRQWHRTFGAIITPLQGSGGTYLRYRKTQLSPVGANQAISYKQFVCGYAVQAGLGASFGSGSVFEVWVRVGLYAILEGNAWLQTDDGFKLRAIHLTGAFGILAEGHGKIDIWIICIRVGVLLSAEARAEVFWIENEVHRQALCQGAQAPGQLQVPVDCSKARAGRCVLQMTFELHARAYAQACIGSKPFRVCKGFHVSTTLRISKDITI